MHGVRLNSQTLGAFTMKKLAALFITIAALSLPNPTFCSLPISAHVGYLVGPTSPSAFSQGVMYRFSAGYYFIDRLAVLGQFGYKPDATTTWWGCTTSHSCLGGGGPLTTTGVGLRGLMYQDRGHSIYLEGLVNATCGEWSSRAGSVHRDTKPGLELAAGVQAGVFSALSADLEVRYLWSSDVEIAGGRAGLRHWMISLGLVLDII